MVEGLQQPDRDWGKAHPDLEGRWLELQRDLPIRCRIEEIYRSDARQAWLWAQGRLWTDCELHGIDRSWARPGPIVTNAWSSRLSAHGYEIDGRPAAAAIDVVPLGPDGKPWTSDDPWDEFVSTVARFGPSVGLIHFHAPGKQVWDRPHLQMVEWSDSAHTLLPRQVP